MGIGTAAQEEDFASVLLTEAQIGERVEALAREIAAQYADKHPLLIGVLKGSIVFLADLMRRLDIPLEIDLICASSYGGGSETSGTVTLLKDLSQDIRGRHVLVVEDIVDTGTTLRCLLDLLQERSPASLGIVALLSKPDRRRAHIDIDFLGFEIPDEFVVGYGLDFAEKYRYLPYLAVLKPEAYALAGDDNTP